MKRVIRYGRSALVVTKQYENARVEYAEEAEVGEGEQVDYVRNQLERLVDTFVAKKILSIKGLLKGDQDLMRQQRESIAERRRRDQGKAALREAGFEASAAELYVEDLFNKF